MMDRLDKEVKKVKTETNIHLSRNELSNKIKLDDAKYKLLTEIKAEATKKLYSLSDKKDAKYNN